MNVNFGNRRFQSVAIDKYNYAKDFALTIICILSDNGAIG
jgi:hypothetical protein